MNSTGYIATATGFLVLTLIMFYLLITEFRKAIALTSWDAGKKLRVIRRIVISVIGWAIFLLLVSYSGFFSDFTAFPPRIMIALAIPLVTIVSFVFSGATSEFLPLIPQRNLVRLQVFRVFVELLLWAAFVLNELPIQMTFEGRNFDILAGLSAPFVAYFLASNRNALYIWNFLSLGLLLNIVTVAILSLPTPLRYFMNEPANVLVARFPFILLPGMLVPLAYGLHFLSLRQLGLRKKLEARI